MLQPIAPELWHAQHLIRLAGLRFTTRMTVVRLPDGRLWLHSPIRLTPALAEQLGALGEVAFVVAPSKSHSAFIGDYLAPYPHARFFAAPGLAKLKPQLAALQVLGPEPEPDWAQTLDQTLFQGIPALNEVVWFHQPTRTLILTDLCQWMRQSLPPATGLVARLTGVRQRLAMPLQLKLITRDRAAARASRERILAWPFQRVVVAHDSIIETDAREAVADALAWLG